MKKILCLFFLTVLNSCSSESDISILEKSINQLNKIETVRYTSIFEAAESEAVYIQSEDTIFFDFSDKVENKTPKYFIKNKEAELIFNGKKHFYSLIKEKLIITGSSRNANNPLLLTLFPVREFLPKIIENNDVEIFRKKDTVLKGRNNYVFNITLNEGSLDWEKLEIRSVPKINSTYTIIIDKLDYLPRKMIMKNGASGTASRTFDNLNFKFKVADNTWSGELLPFESSKAMTFEDYANFLMNKSTLEKNKSKDSIKAEKIGAWKIPNLESGELVGFSELKGNVVLLEFWFMFCGPCVQAVPSLNSIYQKYKDDNFFLYGIEFRDGGSKDELKAYSAKIKMNYPTLFKGKEIANTYNVRAAPTFIIIDKKGNIIYNKPGFNEEEIIKMIEENL